MSDPDYTPLLGFSGNTFDRLADLREDADAVRILRAEPSARTLVVAADTPVLGRDSDGAAFARFTFEAASGLGKPKEVALLGRDAQGPIFGTLIGRHNLDKLKLRDDLIITDMRSVAVKGLIPPRDIVLMATAKSLLDWHRRHRFCANCGAPTKHVAEGWRRECDSCGAQHFPRTDPVSIMLAHRGGRCLLGRQARFIKNSYSCLAGFIEPGETIEEAVRRELKEEAGIRVSAVRYLFSQPWPFPSSLMIGCLADAENDEIVIDKRELEDARWFSREEVRLMLRSEHPDGLITPPPIAIAHHIIRHWADSGA